MSALSAVIITFNEEKNIGRCLESLKGVADEIVVVDSLSTDKTEEICKEHNVRFIQQKFLGYIEQKQFAVEQATYDWVLSLDADEALSDRLKESILQVKDYFPKKAWSMNRLTNYCGKWIKHGGWYPDRKIRLWNRNIGKWGGINPHDEVMIDEGIETDHLKGDLLHYSYYTLDDHYKQVEHFTKVLSQAMFEKGVRSNSIKLMVNPVVKFLKDYIFNAGFLDGSAGFRISRISAYATWLKYKKLQLLYQDKAKQTEEPSKNND